MKLRTFLKRLSSAQKQSFADCVGVQKVRLFQIAGGAEPSALIAARIQRESAGLVTVYDVRPADAHEIWPVGQPSASFVFDADALVSSAAESP